MPKYQTLKVNNQATRKYLLISLILVLSLKPTSSSVNLGDCSDFLEDFPELECLQEPQIGSGQTASIYLVEFQKDSADFNLYKRGNLEGKKVFKVQRKSAETLNDVARVTQLQTVPGVIRLHSSIETEEYVLQVLDFAENGNLIGTINDPESKLLETPLKTLKFFGKIVDTLAGIHDLGLVHGDVKPDNIVLTEDYEPKFIDFSMTKKQDTVDFGHGSKSYMSPELIFSMNRFKEHGYTSKNDVYSLGIVLYMIYKRLNPIVMEYREYDTLVDYKSD